jgi:transcriptional regulator with XRE-family HTH domain
MIGERLRQVRQQRALSLQDVAKAANISAATLSRVENSKQSLEFGLFYRLTKILECRPADLVESGNDAEAVEGEDLVDPLIRKVAALSSVERKKLWEKLAQARREALNTRQQIRSSQLAEQLEELLAQVDSIQAEIQSLTARMRR